MEGGWDGFARAVPGLDIDTFQTKPSTVPTQRLIVHLGDIWLCCTRKEGSTVTRATVPDGYVVLLVPFGAQCRRVINGRSIDSTTLVACGPGSDYISRNAPGKNSFAIAVRIETFRRAMEETGKKPASEFVGDCILLKVDALALGRLRQDCAQLCIWARNSPQLLESYSSRLVIGECLLTTVAKTWLAATPLSTPAPLVGAVAICQRANAYFQQHQSGPVYISEVCAALRISQRTLEIAFHRCFGLPPMAYLKVRRLHEAHQRLRENDSKTMTVKWAALGAGFRDLSRFSSYYRQLFGEFPNDTLVRTVRREPIHRSHPTVPGR